MAGIIDLDRGFSESDKLQGSSNYLIWSFKARNIFHKYKCWITVRAKVPDATIANQQQLATAITTPAPVAASATTQSGSSGDTTSGSSTITSTSTMSTSLATQAAPNIIASPHFSLSTTRINPLETKEDRRINTIIIFSAIIADHLIPTIDMYEDDPTEL